MVGRVLLDDRSLHVTGSGYEPEGEIHDGDAVLASSRMRWLLLRGRRPVQRRGARRDDDADGVRIVGDPTDAALLVLARKAGHDPAAVRSEHERLDAIPFESANRFMATLHGGGIGRTPDPREGCAGAHPGDVRTRRVSADGGESGGRRDAWRSASTLWPTRAIRMLALAVEAGRRRPVRYRRRRRPGRLTLLGVVGLMDPPREEAIDAVARCQDAGIRVVMITGDHALTARSIGARLGIGDGTSAAVTGRDVEAAMTSSWRDWWRTTTSSPAPAPSTSCAWCARSRRRARSWP
jgi:magnesium-transporting ATPase (P-type)